MHQFVDDELHDRGGCTGVHISKIDESDLVSFSEQGDVVVSPPHGLLEVAAGLLEVVLKLDDLRLVHTDAWQFVLNFLPSKGAAGIFAKRPRGLRDDKNKGAFVGSRGRAVFTDNTLNKRSGSFFILHVLLRRKDHGCQKGFVGNLTALLGVKNGFDAIATSKNLSDIRADARCARGRLAT